MHWDVQTVTPLSDFVLRIVRVDGLEGMFDMKPYLDRGSFRELKDPAYFKQVHVLYGAITWPNGQDIAPETLEAGLQLQSARNQA
ncbi:DUF2442 domain-containing protein [Marinobacter bryozoorum]|uniref:DUF2442 domain-containing protein n=1 Tax=Marinobacter bryozoorum TaxID=256324 RepID=UPI002006C818|nr:DUF2442 domain-containing protein [Marinobacter bryozoorum]MCK7544829.1 DUF2442 domain-containing protein [Marinobacter bryozoorum]